jgi:hypothetical protein
MVAAAVTSVVMLTMTSLVALAGGILALTIYPIQGTGGMIVISHKRRGWSPLLGPGVGCIVRLVGRIAISAWFRRLSIVIVRIGWLSLLIGGLMI